MPGPQQAPASGSAPPLVIGADQIVQFRSGADVEALMTFLASPEAAEIWARHGGFLSANVQVPNEVYPATYLTELTDAFEASPAVVFDASDQMPPALGSALLWELMTDWIAGAIDYDTLATTIDEAIESDLAVS